VPQHGSIFALPFADQDDPPGGFSDSESQFSAALSW
jgi:hypothetical protein